MLLRRMKSTLVLLVFFLSVMTTGLQAQVLATSNETPATNEATIAVIGLNGENVQPATQATFDSPATALQLLDQAVGTENLKTSDTSWGTKQIDEINGVHTGSPDSTNYWAFYVNGIFAQESSETYEVQAGDHLTFKLEDWTKPVANSVTLEVVDNNGQITKSKYPISFIGEPTAFQLLQVYFGHENIGYSVHETYGKMLESINGLAAEGTYYWAFYINGEAAMTGADGYPLKPGDEIAFKYESWETPGTPADDPVTEEPGQDQSPPVIEPIQANVIQTSIDNATNYVLANPIGEWEVIALKQAGKQIPETYLSSVAKTIQDKQGKFRSITDYEKYTLAILAAGGDPTSVAGFNLVESIYNGNVTKQGLNGVAYGLIALNSAEFQIPETAVWSKEKLVNELTSKQNPDGGWAWDGSATSDLDSTAMVLTALAPYQHQTDVTPNVAIAVQFLSTNYKTGKIDNSSTAAQTVIALSALGIDANGELFTKSNGESLIEFLITFQNSDGGFDWMGGDESDSFSTAQAFQAIVAYQLYTAGKGTLYSFSIGKSVEQPEQSPVQEDTGMPLPNTAVNSYNLLLLGILLLIVGAGRFIFEDSRINE